MTREQFDKAEKILYEIDSLRGLEIRVRSNMNCNLNTINLMIEIQKEADDILSKRVEDRINILNTELEAL